VTSKIFQCTLTCTEEKTDETSQIRHARGRGPPCGLSRRERGARPGSHGLAFFVPPPRHDAVAERFVDEFLGGFAISVGSRARPFMSNSATPAETTAVWPALVAELVTLDIDVLVTAANNGVYAAHRATANIPIVVITAGDLVAMGSRPACLIPAATLPDRLSSMPS